MFQYYFNQRIKFNTVLNELIKSKCIFITETYQNIDNILYLDPNINYYCDDNDNCINNCNSYDDYSEKLYGDYDDWEGYWDSIYN